MAIDFRLTARQRELQLQSRKFAQEVLSPALAADASPAPEQRFAATRPAYEAMISAGFLRQCIPLSAGGESSGLIDTAIMVEELYAVNASVTLTLIGTLLGLLPLLIGGTEEQRGRLLPRFLKQTGAPLAGFCATEPGGSANAGSPSPGEGVRTTAALRGDRWIIEGRKSWVSSATGWDRKGADILSVLCRTDPDAAPERSISVMLVERPAAGLVFERAIDAVGHRAHLLPVFNLNRVGVPRENVLGSRGGGLALTGACFAGAAALVGIFAVALMRAAFEFTLGFARTELRDLARSIPFYEMLGFEKFDDNYFEEGAGVWEGLGLSEGHRFRAVFMRIPGDRPRPFLDIIQFIDPPTAGDPYPTLHNVGIGRLCFEVDDLFEVAKLLKANKVAFSGPISRYETAKGVRSHGIDCLFLCFEDPDGTILEFIQFKRQSKT